MTDTLGSVVSSFNNLPNGAAVVLGDQVYGPYGNRRVQQGTISTSKGFTGQFTDFVAGLDYYGARYYDLVVGVFVSADTVQGNAQGMNPYGYVGGNPESRTDPSGHCWPWCTMLVGAVAGAIIGGGISAITQAASGHGVNWGEVGKQALVGGIVGGIAGLAGPGAPIAQILGTAAPGAVAAGFAVLGGASGAAGGAIGQVLNNAMHNKPIGDGVGQAALVGGVTGSVFGALQILTPLGRAIGSQTLGRFGQTVTFNLRSSAVNDAGAQTAKDFISASNDLLVRGVQMSRVSTAGSLRREASADASAWAAANAPRPSTFGIPDQAGHIPDTTWTGGAQPPGGYMWLPQYVNSSIGGQASGFPLGTRPDWFNLQWIP